MGFKGTVLDKGTNKRRWGLTYHVYSSDLDPSSYLIRIIQFGADTHKEACDKVLRILKKSAKRASPERKYFAIFHPGPLPGKNYFLASDLYELKLKYSTAERILKVKDPRECFVRGYGPEVSKELYEL